MTRSRYLILAAVYVLLVAYASTFISVAGFNYTPIAFGEAVSRFLDMSYVVHGSDQRSDWMGNLVTLVPLGFLSAGCLSPAGRTSGRAARMAAAIGAFVACLAFILAVKLAQIWFPPRTVTLNYVIAQSLGAIIGIGLFAALRSSFAELARGPGRPESLRVTLRIYAGVLIVFMLMPLDFALSVDDIGGQLARLPETFTYLVGEDRPTAVRLVLLVGGIAATAPLGALLTLMNHGRVHVGRSVGAAAWVGFLTMMGVYAATTMVLSGNASLPAVLPRTAGIALGAWFMYWAARQDAERIRDALRRLVPWAVPAYLVTVLAVNGLLTPGWFSGEAASAPDPRIWLPLFDYYIVSKAEAAKNIGGHVAMYAPIGVMVWISARDGRGGGKACVLAALLSAVVEFGRYLRPGFQPDINAVPLAGVAAWAGFTLSGPFWRMLSAVAVGRGRALSMTLSPDDQGRPIVDWRDRRGERHARRREADSAADPRSGDVEHY